jgi:glutathione reductase (NADPH)
VSALRGCDPKQMLISGAEAIDAARRMPGRGASPAAIRSRSAERP